MDTYRVALHDTTHASNESEVSHTAASSTSRSSSSVVSNAAVEPHRFKSSAVIHTKSPSLSFGLVPPETPRLFQLHYGSSVYTLQPDMPYTIGSDSSATIQVLNESSADTTIAPIHARIHNDQFTLLALGAFINGREIQMNNQTTTIGDGDCIKLGVASVSGGVNSTRKLIHVSRLSAIASAKQNLSLQHQGDSLIPHNLYQKLTTTIQQPLLTQPVSTALNHEATTNAASVPHSFEVATTQHESFHSQTIRNVSSPSNSSFLQQHVLEKEDSALPVSNQSNHTTIATTATATVVNDEATVNITSSNVTPSSSSLSHPTPHQAYNERKQLPQIAELSTPPANHQSDSQSNLHPSSNRMDSSNVVSVLAHQPWVEVSQHQV